MRATGTFTVKLLPEIVEGRTPDPRLGQMSIDKQFAGDLTGTGKGSMLTGGDHAAGSAAYSAIEKVTGSLAGREGSFILQHTGIMARGESSLVITVVPDSGTGALAGLSGAFTIRREDGGHFYDFDYSLP